jgi:hypothetical protein
VPLVGSAENMAENGGPDPHTRRCHPASNGRRALARFILQLVRAPAWRRREVSSPTRCRAHRFQNGPSASLVTPPYLAVPRRFELRTSRPGNERSVPDELRDKTQMDHSNLVRAGGFEPPVSCIRGTRFGRTGFFCWRRSLTENRCPLFRDLRDAMP